MDALRIRLLGGVDVGVPLDSARAVSLLGYLLVHRGEPQPRQRLAYLLWPDSTEAQARTNLRHVLHTLRHGLPDHERFLDVTPRTLSWRADAPYRLDLADFEHALAAGDLQAAVDAYTGDLMDGLYDEWVLEARERVRDAYADALERLRRRHEDNEAWAAALDCAERQVRVDPLGEGGHHALMRLHDARGDRVRAMRAYHAYADRARRELGVVPSAELRADYEALLFADEPAAPPGALPLVGRAAERAALARRWRAAERGQAQLVLVTGEPGIGKTRLVEDLRARCAQAGARTAEARAYAAEGAVAYGPVAAWLRSEAIAPRLRGLDRAHTAELARLLPELGEVPAPAPEQRGRLFAALAHALLADGAPLLLVADDLQWFDGPTLRFLHHLLRAAPAAPVLVVATARREELDAGHAAGELITGLQELGRYAEIALERLSRADAAQLAERVLGAPVAAERTERLFAVSEGNPLYLVEALQAAEPGGRGEAMIAARLARLSGEASELAGVAATIGREFSAPVLADACELAAPAFVRGLDELWRRGIVRAHEHDLYDFSHGRIRETAYARLAPAQRRRHHLRVALALEHGDPAAQAAHYDAAGAAEAAIGAYQRAAEAAQRVYDHEGAVRALERGLALCGEWPERELAILTALPAPLNALDGYRSERLDHVHARASELAARLGVDLAPPLVRSQAASALTAGNFGAARAAGERLRARGESDGDDVLAVEGEWMLAIAAYWSGALGAARGHLEAAIARCRPEHRVEHLLRYGQDTELTCRIRLAHTLWLQGDHEAATRLRDAAVAGADARGHGHTCAIVHLWAALLALDQGDVHSVGVHAEVVRLGEGGPAGRSAEALAGFLEGRAGLPRIQRVVDDALSGRAAAPGEAGLLARILVAACARAGDARAGLAATNTALGTGNQAQPWTAEIRRLQAEFAAEERLRNGGSSTMPADVPRRTDLQH